MKIDNLKYEELLAIAENFKDWEEKAGGTETALDMFREILSTWDYKELKRLIGV